MKLQIRKMGESRWKTAYTAAYFHEIVDYHGIPAAAGLVRLSASTPVFAGRGEDRLKIVDEGFLWLQLAPKNGFFWLTAMYDAQAKLVQFYFDITMGNHIRNDGTSWFADAFVDVVITPGQAPRLLDEDELLQAQREGILSTQAAQNALEQAHQIIQNFTDCTALYTYCENLLKQLRAKLP